MMILNFSCTIDPGQLHYLKCVLVCFEAISNLKNNLAKSELGAIGDVPGVEELAHILGSKVLTMKYLGLPLGSSFKSGAIWDTIPFFFFFYN